MKLRILLILATVVFLTILIFADNTLAYYPNIEDEVLRPFFSDKGNTNGEVVWSNPNIEAVDLWNRVSGDRAQFDGNKPNGIDNEWSITMPDEVEKIYKDLAEKLLGNRNATVNTGLAYDVYYYNNYSNTHEGFDIKATNGTPVKFFTKGKVHLAEDHGSNGWFIYIDEFNASGDPVGRRWKFGHLQNSAVSTGQEVTEGTTLGNVGQDHLHLAVMKPPYKDWGYYHTGNYDKDVSYVLQHRISPIYAYWLYKNSSPEPVPPKPSPPAPDPSPETDPESDFAVAVVILVDVSGSMNDYWIDGIKIESARKAAVQMIDLIEAENEVDGRRYVASLVEFSADAKIIQPMTSNFKLLRHQANSLNATGGTNIGAGLERSLQELSRVSYDRALVILLSDGMSNQGRNPDQIIEWLRTHLIVYEPPLSVGLQTSSYGFKESVFWSEYLGLIRSAQNASNLLGGIGYESYLGIDEESNLALSRLPDDLIFYFIGHANAEKLLFQDEHENKTYLESRDIRRANLEDLQLVVLTGCRTADNIQNRTNILRSFVDSGTLVGIGFSKTIPLFDAAEWSDIFWDKLITEQLTVYEASLAGTWRGWIKSPFQKGLKRNQLVTYPAGLANVLTINDMLPSDQNYIETRELSLPRIYTVGFGDSGDLDEELLRSIAAATGGEYFYGEKSSDLGNIFVRTQHLGTGEVKAEFKGTISQNEELTAGTFRLGRDESELRVSVNWPGSSVDLLLIDPRGIEVTTEYSGLKVWRTNRPAYVIINNPRPGDWSVKLYGADIPGGKTDYYVIVSTGDIIPSKLKTLEFSIVLAALILMGLIAAPRIAGNSASQRRLDQ